MHRKSPLTTRGAIDDPATLGLPRPTHNRVVRAILVFLGDAAQLCRFLLMQVDVRPVSFFLSMVRSRDFTKDTQVAGVFLPGVADQSQMGVSGVAREQHIAALLFSRRRSLPRSKPPIPSQRLRSAEPHCSGSHTLQRRPPCAGRGLSSVLSTNAFLIQVNVARMLLC